MGRKDDEIGDSKRKRVLGFKVLLKGAENEEDSFSRLNSSQFSIGAL